MSSFDDKLNELFPLILKEDDTVRRSNDEEIRTLASAALQLKEPVAISPYDTSDVRRKMTNSIYDYEMNYDEDFKTKVDDFISRNKQTAGKKRRKSKKKKRTKRKLK